MIKKEKKKKKEALGLEYLEINCESNAWYNAKII